MGTSVTFSKLSNKLLQSDAHFLLLILFFWLHGINEYVGLIQFRDLILLLFFMIVIAVVVFRLLLFFKKGIPKTAIIVTICTTLFLFFGTFQDLFLGSRQFAFLSGINYALPLALILVFALILFIIRSGNLVRLKSYLNLLFFAFLIFETVILFSNLQKNHFQTEQRLQQNECDTCTQLPVYVLLLDEYAGRATLENDFKFDNNPFYNQLKAKGFHEIDSPVSNYLFTLHSIASMFNMDYLPADLTQLKSDEYGYKASLERLKNNVVATAFSKRGYVINNYSTFDFKMAPATVKNYLWGGNIRLITSPMLHSRVLKYIPFLLRHTFLRQFFSGFNEKENYQNLEFQLSASLKEASQHPQQPVFTYIHLNIPHQPFLFDSTGNRLNSSSYTWSDSFRCQAYLWNLQQANRLTVQWVDRLLSIYKKRVVILVMSDHGTRPPGVISQKLRHYDNLNMVYYPGINYSQWYKGMSNVNQFRVLMNELFKTNYPLQKDTCLPMDFELSLLKE